MKILFTTVSIFVLAMLYSPLSKPVYAEEDWRLFVNLSTSPCLYGEDLRPNLSLMMAMYVDSICKSFKQTEKAIEKVLDKIHTLNSTNDLLLLEIHDLNIEIKELKENIETIERRR